MRGGSTLFSELFRLDPNNVVWYEPLAAHMEAYYGVQPIALPSTLEYYPNKTRRWVPVNGWPTSSHFIDQALILILIKHSFSHSTASDGI